MPPVLLQCLFTAVGLYTLFGLLTRDRARRLFPPYAILAAVIAWELRSGTCPNRWKRTTGSGTN